MATQTEQTQKTPSLDELYKNYGRTSDSEIKKLLKSIVLVTKMYKGEGTIFGYYQLGKNIMKDIISDPRGTSHTFDNEDVGNLVEGLKEYKTIKFLVKSSSSLCLKPDIGEVFDQMPDEDKAIIKAIFTDTDSELGVEGKDSHFVLDAVLLK